jgi:hypothetical protein
MRQALRPERSGGRIAAMQVTVGSDFCLCNGNRPRRAARAMSGLIAQHQALAVQVGPDLGVSIEATDRHSTVSNQQPINKSKITKSTMQFSRVEELLRDRLA